MMAAMNSGRVLVKQPAQHAAKSIPVAKTFTQGVFMGTNIIRKNVIRCRTANAASDVSPAVTNSPDPSFDGVADTYAVVDIGGHQLIVEEGRWYTVNRLEAEPGSTIKLGRVLALKSEGEFKVGQPYLENVNVEAQILEDLKGPKVIVYKMKPKKHYRRTNGHRQPLTKILVTKIGA